ncbi:MAG: 4-hydroxybenzoyl-CoA reductase subunit beta [Sedimenticola sp.]|nr:4-hydroxybenzoyl-CoA reductase subunit beta [Sedimenticola sp.]
MTTLSDFHYIRPETTEQAITALTETANAHPLNGGTDLLPNLRRGLVNPDTLIDLSRLTALKNIIWQDNRLTLGAGVTLQQLRKEPSLQEKFPALVKAARSVAGPSHRAIATLGGNLCQDTRCIFYNQSEWWRKGNDYCLKYQGERCHVVPKGDRCYATYHGDIAPLLIALEAEAEITGPDGIRLLPLQDLYQEDGRQHLTLANGELLTALTLEHDKQYQSDYEKVRVRDAIDFPLVGAAVALKRENNRLAKLRVVVTGTNSIPINVDLTHLEGKPWSDESAEDLTKAIRKAVNVLRTTVTGPKYRRRVVMAIAKRLVSQCWQASA